jgi:poly(hydroxyalkanoate) granule-associated protein
MPRNTRNNTTVMVRDNAQHIWLAGLGALATAGEEGNRVFEDLVDKGAKLEKTGRARLEKVLNKAQGRARSLRGEAEGAIGRVSAPIDAGVSTALHKLGIPTRKEILALTRRVEELTRTVQGTKKQPAKRRSAKKAARRTAK